MPFNGTGTFVRVYNWTTDAANGILVRADRMDTETDGIATGLSNCITRDGQSVPFANIPMGTYKFTGLGNGSSPQDSVTYSQVFTSPAFTGTPTAPTAAVDTATTQIATTAYVVNQGYAKIASPTFTGTVVLPSTTSIGNVSATEISYLDGVTSAIQTQMDLKAPLASPALTGVPTAPTAAVGTNTTQVATMAAIVAQAFSSALPSQTGNAGKAVITDGTTASWGTLAALGGGTGQSSYTIGDILYASGATTLTKLAAGTAGYVLTSGGAATAPSWAVGPSVPRSARTSNTILAAADKGSLIDITSGTFTQTFTAAATLGSGWYCYIRNSGTGDVTLDPNASETIDSLATYIMYSGECRLIQCDGSGFNTVVIHPFYRAFTATGTFTKPPGYTYFGGLAWSAGASGERNNNTGAASKGGGGGGCIDFKIRASAVGTTETITIGAGGAVVTGVANGNPGGNTTFGSLLTVYGGGSASISGADWRYGGSVLISSAAASPDGYLSCSPQATAAGCSSMYGGASANSTGAAASGNSIFGAGGGGSCDSSANARAGGTSVFAGAGGAASSAGNGTGGTQPGGGGGATQTGTQSGIGGDGELRVWGII